MSQDEIQRMQQPDLCDLIDRLVSPAKAGLKPEPKREPDPPADEDDGPIFTLWGAV